MWKSYGYITSTFTSGKNRFFSLAGHSARWGAQLDLGSFSPGWRDSAAVPLRLRMSQTTNIEQRGCLCFPCTWDYKEIILKRRHLFERFRSSFQMKLAKSVCTSKNKSCYIYSHDEFLLRLNRCRQRAIVTWKTARGSKFCFWMLCQIWKPFEVCKTTNSTLISKFDLAGRADTWREKQNSGD